MKVFLNEEKNVMVVYCKRKKAELKIIYKDIDTDEIISEEVRENLNINEELDIDLTIPKNYELIEEKEEEISIYESVLEEMRRFRDDLNEG
jgi:hypothetical protein